MTGPIVHTGLVLLRVSDPAVLDEIGAVLALDDFIIGRVSETEVVIDPARMGELASMLSERGLPPLVKKARAPTPSGEWGGDDDTRPFGERPRR